MPLERYCIGELQLTVDKTADTHFTPPARAFAPYTLRQPTHPRAADITVSAYAGALPGCASALLTDVGPGFWSAHREGSRTLFACRGTGEHAGVWRVIVGDADARHFEVITQPAPTFITRGAPLPDPLAFPAAELMLLSHIATRGGAITHACGVRDHASYGAGYLFCGRSGVGKSTTARLWHGHGSVLNDDRVLVRHSREQGFEIHGTPWHGDVPHTDPGRAPLRAVFFLEHAAEHWLRPLDSGEALRRLLTSVWLPLWDHRGGGAQTLELCARLVRSVPCFRLGFRRDNEVIDMVRNAATSGRLESLAVPA
jgi:hypothetical protein